MRNIKGKLEHIIRYQRKLKQGWNNIVFRITKIYMPRYGHYRCLIDIFHCTVHRIPVKSSRHEKMKALEYLIRKYMTNIMKKYYGLPVGYIHVEKYTFKR